MNHTKYPGFVWTATKPSYKQRRARLPDLKLAAEKYKAAKLADEDDLAEDPEVRELDLDLGRRDRYDFRGDRDEPDTAQ